MRLSTTFVLQLAAASAFLPSILAVDVVPTISVEVEKASPSMAHFLDRIAALNHKAIPVNTIPEDLKSHPMKRSWFNWTPLPSPHQAEEPASPQPAVQARDHSSTDDEHDPEHGHQYISPRYQHTANNATVVITHANGPNNHTFHARAHDSTDAGHHRRFEVRSVGRRPVNTKKRQVASAKALAAAGSAPAPTTVACVPSGSAACASGSPTAVIAAAAPVLTNLPAGGVTIVTNPADWTLDGMLATVGSGAGPSEPAVISALESIASAASQAAQSIRISSATVTAPVITVPYGIVGIQSALQSIVAATASPSLGGVPVQTVAVVRPTPPVVSGVVKKRSGANVRIARRKYEDESDADFDIVEGDMEDFDRRAVVFRPVASSASASALPSSSASVVRSSSSASAQRSSLSASAQRSSSTSAARASSSSASMARSSASSRASVAAASSSSAVPTSFATSARLSSVRSVASSKAVEASSVVESKIASVTSRFATASRAPSSSPVQSKAVPSSSWADDDAWTSSTQAAATTSQRKVETSSTQIAVETWSTQRAVETTWSQQSPTTTTTQAWQTQTRQTTTSQDQGQTAWATTEQQQPTTTATTKAQQWETTVRTQPATTLDVNADARTSSTSVRFW